jgi:hypothetical protein
MTSEPHALAPGDLLRIERRYVVDGQLTCVADEGRFERIEHVGSSEHLVIKGADKEVRMIPLHAIAEIKLVKAKRRSKARAANAAGPAALAAWDPSVA